MPSAREFTYTIKGKNEEIKLHLDRVSTWCFGDFRPYCALCYNKTQSTRYMSNTAGYSDYIINKSLYNGMYVANSRGEVLFENYVSPDCCCCDCDSKEKKDTTCGCIPTEESSYYPGHAWKDPDNCCCCNVKCLSCCNAKPYNHDSTTLSVRGIAHSECTASIEYTHMTSSLQTEGTFHAHAINITFTGEISYESKIAILLSVFDERKDDDYDKAHIGCYMLSKPFGRF